MKLAPQPVREIVPVTGKDVHPPLYYLLLHAWLKLPLPWSGIAAQRAFSVLWALAATLLLDIFWTQSWNRSVRWLALSLFVLSPCLLLYCRMDRSYSMQVALTLLCVSLLWRWILKPDSVLLACSGFAASIALLYTHYAPGLAVLAGFVLIGWRRLGFLRIGIFSAAVIIGYLPWMTMLIRAVLLWGDAQHFATRYTMSGNFGFEHVIKIGFAAVSLTIGESFLPASLVLVPAIACIGVLGARSAVCSGRFIVWLAIAAGIGYVAVARWDSYPFIPARVLWLLPFEILAVALGISRLEQPAIRLGTAIVILLCYLSSDLLYFHRENFLNPGYAAPFAEISAELNRDALPGDLILIDAYNTDAQAFAFYLNGATPYVILEEKSIPGARRRVESAATVWIVRNTRDISPGHITAQVQSEACTGRVERDTLWTPYVAWQRAAMRMAGMSPAPTHFYQLTACAPPAAVP